MRREPAFNERVLWKLLRNRRLDDLKFRRQVPIGPYIVDFVCFAARLVVEADGPLHDPVSDACRDAWLRREGFTLLRFPNSQVSQEPEIVLAGILAVANPSSGPSGHLLPQGEKDAPFPSPLAGEGGPRSGSDEG